MLLKCLLVCLCFFIGKSYTFDASFIKPCKPSDNECILNSGRDAMKHIAGGIPELGIPPIDPMAIDSIRADSANLKLGLRNIKLHGLSKCNIIELARNLDNSTVRLTAECPLIGFGQYDLNGKVLFLKIEGDGNFEIKCDKFKFTVEFKIKYVQQNGDKYWKVTGFDYHYDILDRVHFKFDNLFGGDEARAKPFLDALNNSWKEVVDELGGPMIKKAITINMDNMSKTFHAIPANQLELA